MTEQARYILAKKIARGGMAEIYLGKQVGEDGFQRLCAIKRILPHYSGDNEFIQMFRDEAHICKRLQHANIVRVEGFEEVEGSYAIIMEFVDGADLRTLLHAVEQAKKKMPVPMACYIIAEAARGLHYAHTKVDEITQQALGIVHRDISPQNILVSYEGEIKVTDFGIADAESKLTETRPGIVKGKYSYMSPEQIAAKPVDARTDVFALSIVLWEMLAMRRLFQGENEVDTIQRVKNCRIDAELRSVAPEVDEELDLIVKRGLAKDPRKRYRTAADFEKDLRRYMSKKHPEFTPEDLGTFLKKNMESRRAESAADIKRTLTETNLKPGKKVPATGGPAASASNNNNNNNNGKKKKEGEIEAAKNSAPAISLARPLGSKVTPLASPASRTATGIKGGAHTRAGTGPHLAPPSRTNGVNRTVLFGAIAFIALAIIGKLWMDQRSRPPYGELTVRVQPTHVKMRLDGVPVNRGHWVQASDKFKLNLKVKPGQHVLLISRTGYQTERYEFNIEAGERKAKTDLVLKENGRLANLRIRLKPGEKPVHVDMGEGFFASELTTAVPLAPDVMQGQVYKMVITDGEKDKGFACAISAKSVAYNAPSQVLVDAKARRCIQVTP